VRGLLDLAHLDDLVVDPGSYPPLYSRTSNVHNFLLEFT
jgi:hypothetical protein